MEPVNILFASKILVALITHDGSSSALTLRAGQAAARVPGAGDARRVGETHNLEQAANTEIKKRQSILGSIHLMN